MEMAIPPATKAKPDAIHMLTDIPISFETNPTIGRPIKPPEIHAVAIDAIPTPGFTFSIFAERL